jgi:hypothetical protein
MPNIPTFAPANWYWIVAGSVTQVYSSAVSNFVPIADAAYQAWLSKGNFPSRIATEAELGEVLVAYSLRPIPAGVLQGYDDKIVDELDTMKILRAFSLVVLDEINILRAQHALADRTPAQLKAAVRAKLGV